MGKIFIDHIYLCSSFLEAKALARNFESFKFTFIGLGVKRTIRPICYIRKRTEKTGYTHFLNLRYMIEYIGEFCEYGFLDRRTLKKYPDLPDVLLKIGSNTERWKTVNDYDDDINYDPEYYENFHAYYKGRLMNLIEKLYLAEVIALPQCVSGGLYSIFYEECGKNYEERYFVSKGLNSFAQSFDQTQKLEVIDFQLAWNWVNRYIKYEHDKWESEIRPLTALSYAINRKPFEQVFYATLGLESVYTNGNRKVPIKEQLKNYIPKVFPNIPKNDIDMLYKLRSDFVHGNIAFPNYYNTESVFCVGANYIEYAQKANYLLLRTIQLLVENGAYRARNDGSGGIVFIGE